MMKINFFLDIMHNNVENYDDYVIYIFRNVRYILDNKNNKVYWEYWNKKLKIGILEI